MIYYFEVSLLPGAKTERERERERERVNHTNIKKKAKYLEVKIQENNSEIRDLPCGDETVNTPVLGIQR